MNWFDCLEAFVSVATHHSFSGAARALKTNSSDITKRIQWIEKELETALFFRTTRKVTLTDTGDYFFKQAKALLQNWHDLHAQLIDFRAEPQGELTIAAFPQFFSTQYASQLLAHFTLAYPALTLSLKTVNQSTHLLDHNIDFLIATDKYIADPAIVIGVPLFSFHYSLFASPNYIKQNAKIKNLMDLKKHRCLVYQSNTEWEFENETCVVSAAINADSGDALIQACKMGSGIIRIPDFMVSAELKKGELVRVLPRCRSQTHFIKVYFIKQAYQPRKMTLFLEFIKSYTKRN